MVSFHYLSGKFINVLSSFEENRQPMMTVENGSVRPSFQGAWFSGA
jgi:hypothetical protein